VNRPDVRAAHGRYNPPPGASPVMGLEVAGNVVAAGKGSPDGKWATGLRAHAGRRLAEYTSTPAEHCLPIPRGLGMLEAAALPENFFTVWVNAFETLKLSAARLPRARRLERHRAHRDPARQGVRRDGLHHRGQRREDRLLQGIGADHAINYRTHDFEAEIAAIVGKTGVDVILDMVAATTSTRTCAARDEGRLGFIAFLQGPKAEVDFARVMLKRQTITGSTLRARPDAQKARIAASLEEKVWPLIEAGAVKPVIHQVFPLAAVPTRIA
jgi:NADPH:quinone reductase-like Zn-dependent oxidoreductase